MIPWHHRLRVLGFLLNTNIAIRRRQFDDENAFEIPIGMPLVWIRQDSMSFLDYHLINLFCSCGLTLDFFTLVAIHSRQWIHTIYAISLPQSLQFADESKAFVPMRCHPPCSAVELGALSLWLSWTCDGELGLSISGLWRILWWQVFGVCTNAHRYLAPQSNLWLWCCAVRSIVPSSSVSVVFANVRRHLVHMNLLLRCYASHWSFL